MYRIVVACKGVPANVGAAAVRYITEEFTHRPWHQNVRCEWDGSRLMLQAENDFDSNDLLCWKNSLARYPLTQVSFSHRTETLASM